jgi:outer membrane protein assembly factor BamB
MVGSKGSGSRDHVRGTIVCRIIALSLVAGLLLVPCDIATAEDGGWISDDGNPQRNGISPYETNVEGGGVRWVFNSQPSSSVYGLVVAPDGAIYTVVSELPKGPYNISARTTESIYALYPNGTIKWVSGLMNRPNDLTVGMDGTLYCTIDVGPLPPPFPEEGFWNSSADYVVVALDPKNGSVKWSYDPPGLLENQAIGNMIGGPDGRLFFSAYDQICALDGAGKLLWNISIPEHSSICMFQNSTILTSSYGHLYHILPNGTIEADVPLEYEGATIGGEPVIAPDGDIMVTGYDSIRGVDVLYRANPDGIVLWSYHADANVTFLDLKMDLQGNSYIRCKERSLGPDGNDRYSSFTIAVGPEGSLKWSTKHDTFVLAVSANGILYGMTAYDPYGLAGIKFTALDQNGSVLWEKDTLHGPSPLHGAYGGDVFGTAAIAPDGSVYFIGQVDSTNYGYIVSIVGTPQGGDPGLGEQHLIIAIIIGSVVALLAGCLFVKKRSKGEWQQ